jgi:hypothetical protein
MVIKRIFTCISTGILIFTVGLFWASPTLAKLSDVTDPNKIGDKFHSIGEIITALIPYIFGLAAMLTLLILIWGGISYMISQGDPKHIESARRTITNAIIGLIIILSVGIIFFIIGAVFKINILGQLVTPAYASIDIGHYFLLSHDFVSLGAFLTNIVWFALIAAALIFFGMLVWGGITYLNAGGNEENVERARNTLLGTGIGILIVVASFVIIEIITRLFNIKSIFSP